MFNPNKRPEYVKINSIELERIALGMKQYISKEVGLPLEFKIEQTKREIIVALHTFLLGKKDQKEFTYSKPETWKDHFKQTNRNKWWMRWWVRRKPVKWKLTTIEIEKTVFFPKFIIPEHLRNQPYIMFMEAYPK